MVKHWLHTPACSYLGSDYGQDAKALLQHPQSAGLADGFIQKLRSDVPILGLLNSQYVNLYALPEYPDKTHIMLEVAGRNYDLGSKG